LFLSTEVDSMRASVLFILIFAACSPADAATSPPNIVLIYADDLGYGDVSCNGGAIKTPNIDRLAREGVRFTDAHSSAATCTPSRFALLTGQYAFRQKGTGILPGDANLIISANTVTLPSLLQRAGYATAAVGKWHLGLGRGEVDWNGEIKPGPREVGFDYHFILPATGDRTPCVYVEQGRVVDLEPADPIAVSYDKRLDQGPSGKDRPETLKQKWSHGHDQTIVNGISRIGWMTGGERARWVDEDMADVLTRKATGFIHEHAGQPFFLYFATHDIHVPRVPHSRFVGTSGCGPRGDAITQLDWCVGEVLATLERLGVADNTLVMFASDNGPVLDDGYQDQANELLGKHDPNGPCRAGKYSPFEGGTRTPFIVRWSRRVKAGAASEALFGQVDLAASLAALVGVDVPRGACPDSRNELDTLLGQDLVGRSELVHEEGSLALRVGPWKYVSPGKCRAGLNPGEFVTVKPPGALFNTKEDPGEEHDLAAVEPKKLEELKQMLEVTKATPPHGAN
jgi:arylsulfatase A-like enzyme